MFLRHAQQDEVGVRPLAMNPLRDITSHENAACVCPVIVPICGTERIAFVFGVILAPQARVGFVTDCQSANRTDARCTCALPIRDTADCQSARSGSGFKARLMPCAARFRP